MGYSALVQRFVLFEEDTVSATNEGKLFFEGNAGAKLGKPGFGGNWMLSGGTTSFFGRGLCRWNKTFAENLSLTSEFSMDIRQPYEGEDFVGYIKEAGFVRIRRRWVDTAVGAKVAFENKSYSEQSLYSYDYTISKFKFDFSNPLFGNDQLGLSWQFAFRHAPDSAEAGYLRNNFYISWDKFWKSNYIRADIEAERRVYNSDDLWGDYWHVNGALTPRIGVGNKLTLAPKAVVEAYRYDWATEVYPKRETVELDAGIEWAFSPFIRGQLAPKFYISHAEKEVQTDNFREISLRIGADWLKHKKIWFYSNLEFGQRFYDNEPPVEYSMFSDFVFIEGSAFGTLWIREGLRLDLIASYSPEWHDLRKDDLTSLYFSTNLRYEFFSR